MTSIGLLAVTGVNLGENAFERRYPINVNAALLVRGRD